MDDILQGVNQKERVDARDYDCRASEFTRTNSEALIRLSGDGPQKASVAGPKG
jgi:hypothetical protein